MRGRGQPQEALCVQVGGEADWEEDGRVSSGRSEGVGDRLRRERERTSLWTDPTWDGGHQKSGRTLGFWIKHLNSSETVG